jgi:hypothetical protein
MKQSIKPIIIFYPFGKGMTTCFLDAFYKGLGAYIITKKQGEYFFVVCTSPLLNIYGLKYVFEIFIEA